MWNLGGDDARELTTVLIEKSHCPKKVERLKYYFGEQSHSERSEKSKIYCQRYHNGEHREESLARDRERHRKYGEKQKLIREYMKTHPEVVAEVMEKV